MIRTLRVGFSIFRIRAAEGLQYRLAAFSGATVSIFWSLIEVVVMTVFYKYGNNTSESINGLSLSQSISYIWLAQFMFGIIATNIDGDILGKINSGDVGIELCRPLDLYWHWFARMAAGKTSAIVLRGGMVLIFAAALTFFGFGSIGLGMPHTFINFILYLLSFFSAFIFGIAYNMFITAIRMGISWGDGPINLISMTGQILSGAYLPLQLWPDFMQKFLRIQPFASYLDTPARLYVGSVDIQTGLISILFQFIWIIIFVVLGRIIMKNKIKNVVVQGG